MKNYLKAIKVIKYCKNKNHCDDCIYRVNCRKSKKLLCAPLNVNIKDLAKVIKNEKWKVK